MSASVLLLLAVLGAPPAARGGGRVADSAHNLSVSAPGRVRATNEAEVCVFCHVSHDEEPRRALWSRPLGGARYEPYTSSSMSAPVGQPDGASRLCLSCHDGTVAVTAVKGRKLQMMGLAPGGLMPLGRTNLGLDLRDDHPVSQPVPKRRPEIHAPSGGPVALDAGGKVQCTSCHDPHSQSKDPLQHSFLVGSNAYSALCLECHAPRYWLALPAAHQSSLTPFRPEDGNHTPYATVAETGCESCHRPHSAARGERILKGEEEATCLSCHAGRVAPSNVLLDLQKAHAHPVLARTPSVHDAAEGPVSPRAVLPERSPGAQRHAECVDCHNPHAATTRDAVAPFATGALAGVWGIDRLGIRVDDVRYEYEVCFKCHGDSANQPGRVGAAIGSRIRRQIEEPNLRLALSPQGPSAHPVLGPGRNPRVPGLLGGLTPSSQIRCTDCHGSDAGTGAPHGSIHEFLLVRNYSTADLTAESEHAYALCYGCHDRRTLLGTGSGFPEHERHVVRQQAPCSACHTAHGVSLQRGDLAANAHLVNFDLGIVGRGPRGALGYEARGVGAGTCSLRCHGRDHDGAAYGGTAVGAASRLRPRR